MASAEQRQDRSDELPISGERTQTRTDYLREMEGIVLSGESARGLILRDLRDLRAGLEEYTNLRDKGPREQGLAELEELQAQILGEDADLTEATG